MYGKKLILSYLLQNLFAEHSKTTQTKAHISISNKISPAWIESEFSQSLGGKSSGFNLQKCRTETMTSHTNSSRVSNKRGDGGALPTASN